MKIIIFLFIFSFTKILLFVSANDNFNLINSIAEDRVSNFNNRRSKNKNSNKFGQLSPVLFKPETPLTQPNIELSNSQNVNIVTHPTRKGNGIIAGTKNNTITNTTSVGSNDSLPNYVPNNSPTPSKDGKINNKSETKINKSDNGGDTEYEEIIQEVTTDIQPVKNNLRNNPQSQVQTSQMKGIQLAQGQQGQPIQFNQQMNKNNLPPTQNTQPAQHIQPIKPNQFQNNQQPIIPNQFHNNRQPIIPNQNQNNQQLLGLPFSQQGYKIQNFPNQFQINGYPNQIPYQVVNSKNHFNNNREISVDYSNFNNGNNLKNRLMDKNNQLEIVTITTIDLPNNKNNKNNNLQSNCCDEIRLRKCHQKCESRGGINNCLINVHVSYTSITGEEKIKHLDEACVCNESKHRFNIITHEVSKKK